MIWLFLVLAFVLGILTGVGVLYLIFRGLTG